MKKSNPFLKKRKMNEEMTIQITSMADIFTIILVFLLKSFSTSSANVAPSAGLTLPSTLEAEEVVEAVRVEISEKAILVENQNVSTLEAFRVDHADMDQNGSVKSLNVSLSTEKQRQTLISQANPDVKLDQKLLVIADKKVPYLTLKAVLASASVSGYTDFKLVVAKKE